MAAEQAYRRAIRLDPTFAEARAELGCLMMDSHRYPEAADCFAQALGIPTSGSARNIEGAVRLLADIARLRHEAAQQPAGQGRTLLDEALFMAELGRLELEAQALEVTELRILEQLGEGKRPGPQSSDLCPAPWPAGGRLPSGSPASARRFRPG